MGIAGYVAVADRLFGVTERQLRVGYAQKRDRQIVEIPSVARIGLEQC